MVRAFEQYRNDRAGVFLLVRWEPTMAPRFAARDDDGPGQRMYPVVFADRHLLRRHANSVMYRASIVRDKEAFHNVSFPFADVQKHLEILEHWDFGFAHQVLSFSRRDNESIVRLLSHWLLALCLGTSLRGARQRLHVS
jgi:hypothetical protein